MFISKTRNIIIPQSEHAQLAGTIALLWGNTHFDKPDFNFNSFVKGVALHDLGHGYFDTNPIGAMDENQAYKVDRALVNTRLEDPIADTVAHFHILRLMSREKRWSDLVEESERRIAQGIKESSIARDKYIWADRITAFCDFISFDFCFDNPTERVCAIAPKKDSLQTANVRFIYDGKETIRIKPWPFCVDIYQGYILGYASENYPQDLNPVIRKYTIVAD